VSLSFGGAIGYKFLGKVKKIDIEKIKRDGETMIENAKKEAEEFKVKNKENTEKLKTRIQDSIEMSTKLINQTEQTLKNKEQNLQKQEEKLNQQKLKIAEIEEEISAKEEKIKKLEKDFIKLLAEKSKKTETEAKEEILGRYEGELNEDKEKRLASTVEQTRENSHKIAQKIIISAIQRLCSPTSVEPRAILVEVPKDIIKGKIVGKEAQNILYLEEILKVDIVFNDLPKTISLSSFNLVDRRIAQKVIQKLVGARGDINKAVIDGVIKDSKKEIDKELYEIGKKMVDKVGLKNLNEELIKIIGRLQYRTSYSQNIMRHSMEVGYLATMIASELGLDVNVCKVAGFLHDLGKAIDQDPNIQGSHDFLTKELMEKYKFSKEEIHAAWTHHESEKPSTPEALIIQAADALSASRPGARQESIEKYIERLQALERTASIFEGVKKAFAISAGREVRVIVDPELVNDEGTQTLATKIAQKIESDLSYPGKVKVNAIRKTKVIEIAK
jgi:ribonuclease Y